MHHFNLQKRFLANYHICDFPFIFCSICLRILINEMMNICCFQAEHRTMAAFVLSMIVNEYRQGQVTCIQTFIFIYCTLVFVKVCYFALILRLIKCECVITLHHNLALITDIMLTYGFAVMQAIAGF